ncbi:Methyltransferase type 11 [Desulfovibrio sp. X2]|uniref:methyltransferase domain-containing protein n=1 Tax=Desulfovibrio sp. X2 TaxID=941449 RepID=UPI0003587C27|nr:methyltransferase domain-containing protein [Desulfovibrio sp. X2]EPR37186.1 Methyltransferase type 11 [Desulfovibrio sp. X2]
MHTNMIALLHCPACKAELELTVYAGEGGEVHEGLLTCESCGTVYPITGSIPRMVPTSLHYDPDFLTRHGVDPKRLLHDWEGQSPDIAALQKRTEENFGKEWQHYATLGWTGEGGLDSSTREESVQWFHEKSLLAEADVAGRLTLDAGCGNGRFSRAAFAAGARVVSMDLTCAAPVAYSNLKGAGLDAQVVQGDILHPPFKPGVLDVVFSIGVIQHTGAPLEATAELAGLVRPGGLLSVRTYRRANPRLEENDAAIRAVTTTFSIEELHEFTDLMHNLTMFLWRKGLYWQVARHINIFPQRYDIFDWYAAPVAAKLTHEEMREAFAKAGVSVLRDDDDGTTCEERLFGAISILGEKRS